MLISIRSQLALIIGSLILLAIVSTMALSLSLIAKDYEEKMHHNNFYMAENLAANISQFMQNAYNISQLAENPQLSTMSTMRQQDLLTGNVKRYPFFQFLSITNLDGNQTFRSSGPLISRADRWWFKKFMSERDPFISKAFYSVFTDFPITTIIHGIYANGNLIGILKADMEIKELQQMIESYNSGEGSYAYILDGEGGVIAHPDRQQVIELYNYKTMKRKVLLKDATGKMLIDGQNNEITEEISFEVPSSLKSIIDKVMDGQIGIDEYTDFAGDEYICAYRAILLPGKSKPWSLIVVQKKSAVMAFMNDVTVKTTFVGCLVLTLAALLTVWFSRKLTNPLVEIVEATNKIKTGNLSVQLALKSGNEIGILAANFNQMVCELQQYRENLENLVEVRTVQLDAANQEMLAMNEELLAVNDELTNTNEILEDTNLRLQDEIQIRCQTEDHLLLRERQYRAITGLLTQSAKEKKTETIFETILHNAVQLLGGEVGYIGLFSNDGNSFYIHHGVRIDPARIMQPESGTAGMKGHVYATGELCYVENYQEYSQRIQDKHHCNLSTVIMVPLKQAELVNGILAVGWVKAIRKVSREDLEGLRQFGDLASVALESDTAQKQIREMAFHDALTGLPNRASLNLFLTAELEQARAGKTTGTILFVDMDDLKSVNDNFGHSYGDKIIVSAGRQISAVAGSHAFVSRIGGDEFVIIVPKINKRESAAQIAAIIVKNLCTEYEIGLEKLHMSASIGVAIYPDDGDMPEDILKKVDTAMYVAKNSGRNCWRFYEPVMLQEAYQKVVLTNGLRHGLERGEFFLNYQPQFNTGGTAIVGFEALLRWKSSDHGFVSPACFIPLAEQSGLILSIGQWVLQTACQFALRLADTGNEHIRVAVNISPRQLIADDFVTMVSTIIESTGIQPNQIELEITEGVLIESVEDSICKLGQLRDLGIILSLDDFGTGYSSLTYLKSLPVDIVKIDKSFIDNIATDDTQSKVVGSIINLGHSLGLTIVGEGVETSEQLHLLTELGCDHVQGYIFSKPLAAEDAMRMLT